MSSLRKVEVGDIHYLHNINTRCLPENYPMEFYLSIAIKYGDISWVAIDNSMKPIGYILLTLEPLPSSNISNVSNDRNIEKSGYIASIAVMPEWRRNALAQKLIDAALMSLGSIGVKSSHLHVRVGNQAAISLYKKLGYVIISTVSKYYKDNEDAFIMQKIIN
ncbi:poxvirus early transcription factor [Faustovirus]|nr:poxvirus early transcription factor [Faustovirus]